MTSPEHYQRVEKELTALLDGIPILKDVDRLEVMHFIGVGEYGLALESFIGSVVENQLTLSAHTRQQVRNLADLMELEHSPVRRYLNER